MRDPSSSPLERVRVLARVNNESRDHRRDGIDCTAEFAAIASAVAARRWLQS